MTNIKPQMKRIRMNEKARLYNWSVKSKLRTFVRKTHEAMAVGDRTAAESALRVTTRKLDTTASKGIIHENRAAQRKSKLATSVAVMDQPPV